MRAILTYHSVDRSESVISVTPEAFEQQLDSLLAAGVEIVDLPTLFSLPNDANAVAITFDDGLASVAAEAAPRLAARGAPATVFVVTGHAGGDNQWGGTGDPGIPPQGVMPWEQLGRLVEARWTIGSHTVHHRRLNECSDSELVDELAQSAEAIDHELGARPRLFAYPYGAVDARVAKHAAANYTMGCTTNHLALGAEDPPLRVPRLDAWYFRHPNPFRGWGTPRFARGVRWRHALRTARRMLP